MEKIKPKDKVVLNWINKALKEKHKDKKDYSHDTKESLNLALKKMENRLDKIYEDKLDEVISAKYYKKKYNEFTKKKKEILEELGKLNKRVNNYYEISVEIHDLAFRAKEKYHSDKATFDDKRSLVNRIFSELKLNSNRTLEVKYTPAFEFLAEWMPKLNATSELLKKTEKYRKTGTLVPAHPILLGVVKDVGTVFKGIDELIYIPNLTK